MKAPQINCLINALNNNKLKISNQILNVNIKFTFKSFTVFFLMSLSTNSSFVCLSIITKNNLIHKNAKNKIKRLNHKRRVKRKEMKEKKRNRQLSWIVAMKFYTNQGDHFLPASCVWPQVSPSLSPPHLFSLSLSLSLSTT